MTWSKGQTRHTGLVMRLLRDRGQLSRTRLADLTGLSPTTITRNVAELLERGWVEELGASAQARVGRPAIDLRQRTAAIRVCGIQIGVGIVRIGMADGRADTVASRVIAFDPQAPADQVLDLVAGNAAEVIADGAGDGCLAVGVAAPGPVDAAQRVNLLSINLGWRRVRIAERLESALRLPVVVDRTVRAMALAESRYGGHDRDSLAYLYVKAGVGLGVVLQGQPFFAGAHGASELGHIRVRDEGELCHCGSHGCLETVASEPYLRRRLEELGVSTAADDDAAVIQVLETEAADGAVRQLRAALIGDLSRGLSMVSSLLNPEVIVLGGILARAPESFFVDLRTSVQSEVFPLLRDDLRLVRPTFAEPGIAGGAAIGLEATVYADGGSGRDPEGASAAGTEA